MSFIEMSQGADNKTKIVNCHELASLVIQVNVSNNKIHSYKKYNVNNTVGDKKKSKCNSFWNSWKELAHFYKSCRFNVHCQQ